MAKSPEVEKRGFIERGAWTVSRFSFLGGVALAVLTPALAAGAALVGVGGLGGEALHQSQKKKRLKRRE